MDLQQPLFATKSSVPTLSPRRAKQALVQEDLHPRHSEKGNTPLSFLKLARNFFITTLYFKDLAGKKEQNKNKKNSFCSWCSLEI